MFGSEGPWVFSSPEAKQGRISYKNVKDKTAAKPEQQHELLSPMVYRTSLKQKCDPMFVEFAKRTAVQAAPESSIGAVCPLVLTADRMLDVLETALHCQKTEWLFLRELRIGTGHRHHELQRLDAFALNCLPHLGMKRVCYEVKASRADYFGEVKNPLKRRIGMRFSNEFYFVTPAGMLAIEEVPAECGLVEIGTATDTESQRLIRRHSGFFYIDPQSGSYCMI